MIFFLFFNIVSKYIIIFIIVCASSLIDYIKLKMCPLNTIYKVRHWPLLYMFKTGIFVWLENVILVIINKSELVTITVENSKIIYHWNSNKSKIYKLWQNIENQEK